jgi:hypothetical protein
MAAPFAVENVTDAQQLSQMATLSNGNFVVVYQDDGNFTETDIEYAIFTANSAQDYFSKSGGIKQGQGSGRNLDSQGPQQFTHRGQGVTSLVLYPVGRVATLNATEEPHR